MRQAIRHTTYISNRDVHGDRDGGNPMESAGISTTVKWQLNLNADKCVKCVSYGRQVDKSHSHNLKRRYGLYFSKIKFI